MIKQGSNSKYEEGTMIYVMFISGAQKTSHKSIASFSIRIASHYFK